MLREYLLLSSLLPSYLSFFCIFLVTFLSSLEYTTPTPLDLEFYNSISALKEEMSNRISSRTHFHICRNIKPGYFYRAIPFVGIIIIINPFPSRHYKPVISVPSPSQTPPLPKFSVSYVYIATPCSNIGIKDSILSIRKIGRTGQEDSRKSIKEEEPKDYLLFFVFWGSSKPYMVEPSLLRHHTTW